MSNQGWSGWSDVHCSDGYWLSAPDWSVNVDVLSEAAQKLKLSLCVSLLPSSHILCISSITWTSNPKKKKRKTISHSLLLSLSILLPGQQRPSCRAPSVLGTHHRPVINVEWQSERGSREGEAEEEIGRKRLTTTERERVHRSTLRVRWLKYKPGLAILVQPRLYLLSPFIFAYTTIINLFFRVSFRNVYVYAAKQYNSSFW